VCGVSRGVCLPKRAVCCSVSQCVAVRCKVLQGVAVRCVCGLLLSRGGSVSKESQICKKKHVKCVGVCESVLQCVIVYYSVL